MIASSPIARLTDIIEAIELIQSEMAGVTLDAFEGDRRKRWLVERGIEIISEASRRLPAAMKARRTEIPCGHRQRAAARIRGCRARCAVACGA
jgi:uncharacterized protein with HEPN domain